MPSIFNPFVSIIFVHCLMNRGTPSLSTIFSRGEPKYLCRSGSCKGGRKEGGGGREIGGGRRGREREYGGGR